MRLSVSLPIRSPDKLGVIVSVRRFLRDVDARGRSLYGGCRLLGRCRPAKLARPTEITVTSFRQRPAEAMRDGEILNDRLESPGAVGDLRALTDSLASYREPNHGRSIVEILITVIPFILLWLLMWWSLRFGYGVYLLLAVPTAGFLVRLFMIQHDCGHGSFFRRRFVNDWVGRVIGVFTLTPYDFWRRTHGIHHAASGNLDRRGIGDVDMLTVREYLALSRWRRLGYRLYRNPVVLFGIGPAYLFMLRQRLPFGLMADGWVPWVSTMATNGAIALVVFTMMWWIGVGPFLLVHLPIAILGGAIGVWLFYVQHQFEHTNWSDDRNWRFATAALHGSSHYDLPAVLRWFTANIGVHHVHHLCSRIPFYRLQPVLRDHPELGKVGRLTLGQSLGCIRLVLWDEAASRLITFRELRIRLRSGAADRIAAASAFLTSDKPAS
jgi:acyl-lipid omega-6 desaturase (Delta-12 desaturase)